MAGSTFPPFLPLWIFLAQKRIHLFDRIQVRNSKCGVLSFNHSRNSKAPFDNLNVVALKGFPGASDYHLPAMRETRVRSLGWEEPLEEGTATHSSILA